jgi:hypothetical protein
MVSVFVLMMCGKTSGMIAMATPTAINGIQIATQAMVCSFGTVRHQRPRPHSVISNRLTKTLMTRLRLQWGF